MSYFSGIFGEESMTEFLARYEISDSDLSSLLKSTYTVSVAKNEQIIIDLEKINIIHGMRGLFSIGISDAQGVPTTLGLLPSGGNLVVGNWLSTDGIAMELRSVGVSELMVVSIKFGQCCRQLSIETESMLNKLSAHTLGRLLNAEAQKRYLSSLDAMTLIVSKLRQQADTVRLSSEEFAELIGCSRQQASRNLNLLEERGQIERCYGGFQVIPSLGAETAGQNLRDSFPVL